MVHRSNTQALDSVATPFVAVNQSIVQKNIDTVSQYAKKHKLNVRPHIKAHKSLAIAAMQMATITDKIAVAKVGEAEVFSALAPEQILIAYPLIDRQRLERAINLSKLQALAVCIDSPEAAQYLGRGADKAGVMIEVLIEVDTGLKRCGISSPEQAQRIIEAVSKFASLRLNGISIYNGHLYGDICQRPDTYNRINTLLEPILQKTSQHCPKLYTVSSASTPSLFHSHEIEGVNEIRYGSFVYNDYWLLKQGHCQLSQCAASVIATVISDSVADRVMIDAGSKAISPHYVWSLNQNEGYGYIVEYPEAFFLKLHEEIGFIDVSQCKKRPRIGERLTIIPANVALTVNLYDQFYLIDSTGKAKAHKIEARGMLV